MKYDDLNTMDSIKSRALSNQSLHVSLLCKGALMSTCNGCKWTEHKTCQFAEKSAHSDRCMYYRPEMDGACDCLTAQLNS